MNELIKLDSQIKLMLREDGCPALADAAAYASANRQIIAKLRDAFMPGFLESLSKSDFVRFIKMCNDYRPYTPVKLLEKLAEVKIN